MEITEEQIPWLDEKHPNYERWKRAREISFERGKFVKSIISEVRECRNLIILDIGSGEGGTSKVLTKDNSVISYDLSKVRLQRQSNIDFQRICGSSLSFPFNKNLFDVIILQDVLEHLDNRKKLIDDLYKLLKEDGIIYLSTPNKFSIINILADPHWGVPFVSLLKKENIKKYFLNNFRKSELSRNDIAELLSINMISKLVCHKFQFQLFTKRSVEALFNGNKGIVWSNFHLKLINILTKLKLNKMIIKIANNKIGLVNKLLTPTFYMVLRRDENYNPDKIKISHIKPK